MLYLVLRVYFIIIITLLEIIRSKYYKYAAKVNLLSSKNIKLNYMTRQLRLVNILLYIYKLRILPGDALLGFIIIIITLLLLIADLLVAKLVLPAIGPSKCLFITRLVMNQELNKTFSLLLANSYLVLITSNTQIYSNYANYSISIYKKVPRNSNSLFYKKESNILG